MCAINGFTYRDSSLLNKMMSICSSRGPDDKGFFFENEISLGHNRLAIIDPNERSKQPFIYKNLVLSFNGEIYNFLELKEELKTKGYKFSTKSDTEVLIKLFHCYELESFKKISGIFSISIWDKFKKALYLIRDIVGVKPLYYSYKNGNLFFSTLIKPLLEINEKQLNIEAVNYYSNFGYNDLTETFFKNILKLEPGELIIFKNKSFKKEKFLKYNFKKNLSKNDVKEKIIKTINKQTISDVPIALSLSGGIDSNIILSTITKNLRTYNISFTYNNVKSSDSIHAADRAKLFNTEHQEINVSNDKFINTIEKVNNILEEPVGNQNSVTNLILSENIKEKVIMCGDGGDEIFTGYDKYRSIYFLSILNKFKSIIPKLKIKNKNFQRLFFNDTKKIHLSFSNQNILDPNLFFLNYRNIKFNEINYNHLDEKFSKFKLENVMLADLDTWVKNDVLLRNDKIYMNKGTEVRVPYLDQELIESCLFYSSINKINFFKRHKPLLRTLFKKELKGILRQKKGFESPIDYWIKEEKNKKILEYYFSNNYYKSSLLNYDNIKQTLDNKRDQSFKIFSNLMLQIFLKQNNF